MLDRAKTNGVVGLVVNVVLCEVGNLVVRMLAGKVIEALGEERLKFQLDNTLTVLEVLDTVLEERDGQRLNSLKQMLSSLARLCLVTSKLTS